MIVKCKENFRHQLKEGDLYLVIEIFIRYADNYVSYRLIDYEGYPAIYDADKFVIVSNHINHFAILLEEDSLRLSPNHILNSDLNKKHVDGFWGLFIEDDLEAKKVLKQVVEGLALEENIYPPDLKI